MYVHFPVAVIQPKAASGIVHAHGCDLENYARRLLVAARQLDLSHVVFNLLYCRFTSKREQNLLSSPGFLVPKIYPRKHT